jgi:hypothetical protein
MAEPIGNTQTVRAVNRRAPDPRSAPVAVSQREVPDNGHASSFVSAGRPTFKGVLRLSLVCIPVKVYTAAVSGNSQLRLNQLHRDCHQRIQYQKVCAVHGQVPNDQIVSGYEYARGQYVVIDPDSSSTPRNRISLQTRQLGRHISSLALHYPLVGGC